MTSVTMTNSRRAATTLLLCAAVSAGTAHAQALTQALKAPERRAKALHTMVELLVDRQPDATTREVTLGLTFELDQGWHVYWQNPGDSGGPPVVLWQPASGVRSGR
jgi:thiol:disulfide interchange protein DsbD